MKVPFITTGGGGHIASKTTISSAVPPPPAYEPKSVLEIRGSPSPVTEKPSSAAAGDSSVRPEGTESNHALMNPQVEDWDWMTELGLNDDDDDGSSSPVSRREELPAVQYQNLIDFPAGSFDSGQFPEMEFGLLPDFPPAYGDSVEGLSGELATGNWNAGFDFVDELIRLAECFETNSAQLAHMILARLNERLRSPAGKPLQRIAFYFKEALQSLLTAAPHASAGSSKIIQTIKAQKIFAAISPIPTFSSFTAGQALLEAIDGGAPVNVHVVDFDIGFGGHWAPFMKEVAENAQLHHKTAPLPALRISAVVADGYETETNLIRENLTEFARELNIRFDIEFIPVRNFEHQSFKAVRSIDGEKTVVLLSPSIFRHIGAGFMNDLRRRSPQLVVLVDNEVQAGYGTSSYRQTLINGLEFYSNLLESIEASNFTAAAGSGGWDWIRKIETFVLYPKILEIMQSIGRRGTTVRDALAASGLRPVILSQFADVQADCLLRRVQVRGFHVVKPHAEMLLCWHDRPVAATSAWRY
ncbi:hypothetical protein M569_11763 [Genlisea aurea]|uniref:Uncharacterized protein n=1 Tax=Genlisea aurea TaxID=192259 RepID=S8CET2_9LAMI|nr:hypothetical protein M569_11763 [Genlisea aurea]